MLPNLPPLVGWAGGGGRKTLIILAKTCSEDVRVQVSSLCVYADCWMSLCRERNQTLGPTYLTKCLFLWPCSMQMLRDQCTVWGVLCQTLTPPPPTAYYTHFYSMQIEQMHIWLFKHVSMCVRLLGWPVYSVCLYNHMHNCSMHMQCKGAGVVAEFDIEFPLHPPLTSTFT